MNTVLKFVIAVAVGLIISWVSYQLLHLDQGITTAISIIFALATLRICDQTIKK